MISSSFDGAIILSDNFTKNSKTIKLEGHKSLINDISISPTGSLIASASSDHTIRLWDLAK
jgi:WD40 repeat protein